MASKILAVFLALLVTVSSAILICSRDSTIEESAAATKNIQPTSSIWSWWSDTPTIRIVNSNYAEFFGGDHGGGCWEVASFQAATWSVEGGQDDLRWTTSDRGSWDRFEIANFNLGVADSSFSTHGSLKQRMITHFYYYRAGWPAYENGFIASAWDYFPQIDISYHPDGGTGSYPPQSKLLGFDLYLSNGNGFSRQGYHQIGWSTQSGTTVALYELSQRIGYHDWNILSQPYYDQRRENGNNYAILSYRGYVNPTGKQAFTLYAVWDPNTYSVLFDPTGGQCSTTSASVVYDTAYPTSAPVPTRDGYDFLGWFDAPENDTDVSYPADETDPHLYYDAAGNCVKTDTYQTAGDTQLYARWSAKTYEVAFDVNCTNCAESAPESVYAHTNNQYIVTKPDWPSSNADGTAENNTGVRTGYVFIGWYDDAACTTIHDFTLAVKRSCTLYAGWAVAKQNITVSLIRPEETKENPNYALENAKVTLTLIENDPCIEEVDRENITTTAISNAEGKIVFDGLPPGTYRIDATTSPLGFMLPETNIIVIPSNTTIKDEFTINLIPKKSTLAVKASINDVNTPSDAFSVKGIQYAIYRASDAGRLLPLETIVTDEQGLAFTTNEYLFGAYIIVQLTDAFGCVDGSGIEKSVYLLNDTTMQTTEFLQTPVLHIPETGSSSFLIIFALMLIGPIVLGIIIDLLMRTGAKIKRSPRNKNKSSQNN